MQWNILKYLSVQCNYAWVELIHKTPCPGQYILCTEHYNTSTCFAINCFQDHMAKKKQWLHVNVICYDKMIFMLFFMRCAIYKSWTLQNITTWIDSYSYFFHNELLFVIIWGKWDKDDTWQTQSGKVNFAPSPSVVHDITP